MFNYREINNCTLVVYDDFKYYWDCIIQDYRLLNTTMITIFNEDYTIIAGSRNVSDGNYCDLYGNFKNNTCFDGNVCCKNGCRDYVGIIIW